LEAVDEVVTGPAVEAAIYAWQLWENAIDRTCPPNTPAWMKVNGRRWATEPGE
jgi:hypothetical protein